MRSERERCGSAVEGKAWEAWTGFNTVLQDAQNLQGPNSREALQAATELALLLEEEQASSQEAAAAKGLGTSLPLGVTASPRVHATQSAWTCNAVCGQHVGMGSK